MGLPAQHRKQQNQISMIDKKQEKQSGKDICAEVLGGATAALTYTDEEIRATLPPEEAQEFIDLKNRVIAQLDANEQEYSINPAVCDEFPMAAEDETPYGE